MLIFAIIIIFLAACRAEVENQPANLRVVNATYSGVVRRVLVGENTNIEKDAVLIEIDVDSTERQTKNVNLAPPVAVQIGLENQIQDAQHEVERAMVEIQRIEPLVAANRAPSSQLDAARAEFQRAQKRLDQLRRSPAESAADATPVLEDKRKFPDQSEETMTVRAPVGGSVRVIAVRQGQHVRAGQPLATIAQNE